VGTVFLGLAIKGGETLVRKERYFRDRLAFKQTVSQTALEMVLKAAGNVAHTSGVRKSRPSSGRLVFQPFVKDGKEVTKSLRRLPHWQQEGVCYYVTFRLADSMPASVMGEWLTRRAIWLERHGISCKKEDRIDVSGLPSDHQREYRRVFGEEFQRQLDRGHGSCLLRKPANAKVVADTLLHFDGERYDVGDFVVMPNHVHVLVLPKEGHTLSEILKSWKGFSARQINLLEGREGALWQKESFDHIIRSRRQLDVVREYIRENPNVAKLRDGEFVVRGVEW
jgi:type I restriction enzyme R subunit